MANLILKLAVVFVLCVHSHGHQILQENAEEKFEAYLTEILTNYGSWLSDNSLDPTPPAKGTSKINMSFPIDLECELSNQRGHGVSGATVGDILTTASFTRHSFMLYRPMIGTIQLLGNFKCNGKINSEDFPELNQTDLYFSGEGQFSLNSSTSSEIFSVMNFGITDNFTLDFEQTEVNYGLGVELPTQYELNGNWNESMFTDFLPYIEFSFFYWYEESLSTKIYEGKEESHPLYGVFKEYMDIKTKDFDLRTILEEEELPPPYKPTPMPTTTLEPTTEINSLSSPVPAT